MRAEPRPGAVQEQQQAVLVAAVPQSGQLRLGVDGADLGGIGNVDHLGGDHVLRAVMTARTASTIAGVTLPSGEVSTQTLWPVASMAPVSWQLTWPVWAAITAS